MIRNDTIQVAFCASNGYIPHTATAIISILKNTDSPIDFHLIHDDDLTDGNKEKLKKFVQSFGQQIYYHLVSEREINDALHVIDPTQFGYTKASLYRLSVCDLLENIPKVIFLDSDIVVNLNLGILWKENIDEFLCAAVLDEKGFRKKWKNRYRFKQMGMKSNLYFNSGVVIFNLKKIREQMILWDEAIKFFIQNSRWAAFLDQDALNKILQKETKFISNKFNFIPTGFNAINENRGAIIHFAGPKPWNYRNSDYDWVYWKYFSMTPWGNTTEKLLSVQEKAGIDLGYALQVGKIASKKNLLKGIYRFFRR